MSALNLNIVVADDNKEIVDAISKDLDLQAKRFGKKIKIFPALTGSEVLNIAEGENIDVFILDYMFKYGMNGDEIIDNIEDPFEKKLYILISGWKEEELEKIIIKTHNRLKDRIKFLRKPYDSLTFQARFLEIFGYFEKREFPLPIQYVYERVDNSAEGIEKAHAIKDFFETTLKFSVALLSADLPKHDSGRKFSVNLKREMNLTFGAWLIWLKALLGFYGSQSNFPLFMPELLDFFADEKLSPVNLLAKYKDFRDNKLGHGYTQEGDWYKEVSAEYTDAVKSFYKGLSFLSRYSFLVPEKPEIIPDTEDYKYPVISLMGSGGVPNRMELISSHRLNFQSPYLYSSKLNLLSLSPFMIYKLCPQCHSLKLYFLDKINEKAISYNTFCNHRLESKEERDLFEKKYSYIFKNES